MFSPCKVYQILLNFFHMNTRKFCVLHLIRKIEFVLAFVYIYMRSYLSYSILNCSFCLFFDSEGCITCQRGTQLQSFMSRFKSLAFVYYYFSFEELTFTQNLHIIELFFF